MQYTISVCLAAVVFAVFAAVVPGQGQEIKKGLSKKITGGKFPSRSINLVGDPCDEAADIGFGQTIAGVLLSTDCTLPDGSYADFYVFTGTAGQQVIIDMESTQFDTYLGLASVEGTFSVEDDDGGEGTNSRIVATLPKTGLYAILSNSAFPATAGNYFVRLQSNPPCTFTLVPSDAEIPSTGGSFEFGLVTQPSCYWTAESQTLPDYQLTSPPSGYGSATITYTATLNNSGESRTGRIVAGGRTFTITQPTIPCSYSLTPTSVNVSGAETTGQFFVSTGPDCRWSATNNDAFIFIQSTNPRIGPGVVDFRVIANNGSTPRTGTVMVGGQTFTVNQAALGCTYSVSPSQIYVPVTESYGSFNVITQPGCTWLAGGNGVVQILNGQGAGPGPINYRVYANLTGQQRSTTINVFGNGANPVTFVQAGSRPSVFDFDGDGRTDISIFRPGPGQWWYLRSSDDGSRAFTFGLASDTLSAADYTGDGKTDIGFWRPSTGEWYVLRSEDSTFYAFPFGTNGDVPSPADYDGDGKADATIFRPSNSTWYILQSSNSQTSIVPFGAAGDKPVPADYDGDGKADVAIFRPGPGQWWYLRSSDGGNRAFTFGTSTDKTVPGDYTGDGKADLAFWRPSTGEWYIVRSEDSSFYAFPFGASTDIPSPGDYDGDGKTDAAVFRPSDTNWYVQRSTAGILIRQFGTAGDQPVPNSYVR